MKKIITGMLVLLISYSALAQARKHDSVAILIVDRMADVISNLESCSFKLSTANDINEYSHGLVKRFAEFEVYFSGPSKLLINAHGHKGHRQLMYNGEQLAYYSFDENNYGVIPAPETTIETMDHINKQYEIEFPAADFFYPAFTDDLLEHSDSLRFVGVDKIKDKEYFHIVSHNKDMIFQFWVNNDAYNLPAKYAITYKNQPGRPQYLATFSEWQVNPALPAAMFNFLPPPGAAKVKILSKNEK